MANKTKKYSVIVATWYESERGWGTRPDGHSYHLSENDYHEYYKKYCDGLPAEVPDEYSASTGVLETKVVPLTDEEYSDMKRNKGLRRY